MTTISFKDHLTASKPYKPLTVGFKRDVGRNNQGRITVRHQGGGHKQVYRLVDFKYDKKDMGAVVKTVEYDPFRTGFIGLIQFTDGERRYVLLPKDVKVGSKLLVSEKAEITSAIVSP